jgi:hypothetical protein
MIAGPAINAHTRQSDYLTLPVGRAGLVKPGEPSNSPFYAFLTVLGVPMALRALTPLGEAEVLRRIRDNEPQCDVGGAAAICLSSRTRQARGRLQQRTQAVISRVPARRPKCMWAGLRFAGGTGFATLDSHRDAASGVRISSIRTSGTMPA